MTVSVPQVISVVPGDDVTVVTQPNVISVVPIESGVSAISIDRSPSVVSISSLEVVTVPKVVTVVSNPVGSAGAKITVGLTAPVSPNVGDLWIME
jgi:hypothetical protein